MRQTGLPRTLAHRSQMALTTEPRARWMTPFSGPIHLSWLSLTRYLQVWPQFETRSDSFLPLILSTR